MRLRVALLGTLGALLTVVSTAFVLAPDLLLSVRPVRRAVAGLAGTDPKFAMLVASGLVGLYLTVEAARLGDGESDGGSRADRRFAAAAEDPPEAVTADRRELTAAALDADVRSAVAADGEDLGTVRDLLAATAADAYAEHRGVDRERASEAVRAGTWTDDAVAAAFLADDRGPTPSLYSRIRLWLVPERERERRIDRALGALERLVEET